MISVLVIHSSSLSSFPSGELNVAKTEAELLRKMGVNAKFVEFAPAHLMNIGFLKKISALFSNIWSWSASRFVINQINQFKPDIVHFHGLFPYLSPSAIAAAHGAGVRVVQTLHNGRWLCLEGGFYRNGSYCNDCVGTGGLRGVVRGCKHGVLASSLLYASNIAGLEGGRLFKWVDRFISVSDFIYKQHVAAGFPAHKIVTKNNGMNLEAIKRIDSKVVRNGIAYVGRVSRAKGSDVLKRLFDELKTQVNVVGDGPESVELKDYCAKKYYKHVRFWGKLTQEQCFEIMAGSCCTVSPSTCGEAFGLAAVESMGLGTPVVGFDVGGLGPLLRDSGGGVPVPFGDVGGFVAAVKLLIDNGEIARKLGATGKMYVENRLNMDLNIAELIGIYQELLAEN